MTSSHDLPRTILLWLAVVGAVAPLIFFARFFATEGYAGFVPALFVNGAAGGFTTDLLISSLVFWIFAFAETRRGALSRPLAVRGHQPGDRIVVCVAARPESVAAEPSLGQLVWQSVVTVQRRTEPRSASVAVRGDSPAPHRGR